MNPVLYGVLPEYASGPGAVATVATVVVTEPGLAAAAATTGTFTAIYPLMHFNHPPFPSRLLHIYCPFSAPLLPI